MEDETITIPWITLFTPKGEERWRHWCREYPYYEYPELGFGEMTPDTIGSFQVFRQGFGKAIGPQILACSYLSMKEFRETRTTKEVPIRAIAIPESGGKTRIVTTGPYWLNVLQQGSAHVSRAFLRSHPSASAGLGKVDQAWQYLYLASKAEGFPLGSRCLSSDLEEATDAIPHEVALQLLKGFQEGLGYLSPLYDVAAELVSSPRSVKRKDGSFYQTCRGVFMGEPLTKTVLTLLNLACEEIAIRHYLKISYDLPVQVSWRAYSVGGDDHIALGPIGYLSEITQVHLQCGSKISTTKHAVSSRFVKYCEKLLDVRNLLKGFNPRTINNSTKDYEESPFIDSVKVRLLSPSSVSSVTFNEKNVAIGKGKSLGRTLRWLNLDHFPPKWVDMVRDRFFTRMGSFMPDRSSGVYWHLLLPEYLGGLGLWREVDIPQLLHHLPDPSKMAVKGYVDGLLDRTTEKLFRGFTSNSSYRGYQLNESAQQLVEEIIVNHILPTVRSIHWKEAKLMVAGSETMSDHLVAQALRAMKYLSEEEIIDTLLRPFLFSEILSGEARPNVFNTVPFKKRYATLWDLVYNGINTLTEDELRKSFKRNPNKPLYDIGSTIGYYGVDLIEETLTGMPVLKLQWSDIGTLT